jgi:hypothetical protein
MPNYTVQQGDHLSGIAEQFGFQNIDTIWNHPNNAALKKLRKNPHILFPGDILFIPDKTDKNAPAPTTKLNKFQIDLTKLKLNLKLQDINGDPIASKPVTISLEGAVVPPPATDGNGQTSSTIKKSAKNGFLVLGDLEFQLQVGSLDPIDKPSGQIARLNNLGYEAGDTQTVDTDAFESAVEEFQCDNQIKPITGACDGNTQGILQKVHGC